MNTEVLVFSHICICKSDWILSSRFVSWQWECRKKKMIKAVRREAKNTLQQCHKQCDETWGFVSSFGWKSLQESNTRTDANGIKTVVRQLCKFACHFKAAAAPDDNDGVAKAASYWLNANATAC